MMKSDRTASSIGRLWIGTGETQETWWRAGWTAWPGMAWPLHAVENVLGLANRPCSIAELSAGLAERNRYPGQVWRWPAWDEAPFDSEDYRAEQRTKQLISAAGFPSFTTVAGCVGFLHRAGLLVGEERAGERLVWLCPHPPALAAVLPLAPEESDRLAADIALPFLSVQAQAFLERITDPDAPVRPTVITAHLPTLAERSGATLAQVHDQLRAAVQLYPVVVDCDPGDPADTVTVSVDWKRYGAEWTTITARVELPKQR